MKQHDLLEQFTQKWITQYRASGKEIHCRDGCSGCCHLAVHATYPEAAIVAKQLSETQAQKLAVYIERLKSALPQWTGLKSYLKNHKKELGPCPFLCKEGSCAIYAMRPLSCRALLSTRPAAWCKVDFSELDSWDKQAYESSLDRHVVTWPTHYVAAVQSFGQELESSLLESMQDSKGWNLSGNFAAMIWLEQTDQLGDSRLTAEEFHSILAHNNLNSSLLFNFSTKA